ncbi:MAG: hypothetical protein NTV79_06805 [Candidatus Aureabacteria bacterium]|nr:hypothetical protein [Candidatus Auribacterota bacterium]
MLVAAAFRLRPANRVVGQTLILLAILAIAALFRFRGLEHFSQVGGDDVEFRVHIPDHVEAFGRILKSQNYYFPRLQAPFLAAVYLSHWDVNKKVTSFAKPLFILEVGIINTLFDLRTKDPYENIWRLHLWMAVLGIATVAAVFFLARRLGGYAAGCAAAFLVAVSPWAVRYSTWALHTAGGGLWFCLALLAASALSRRDSAPRNLLFGALLGVSVYYSVSMIWPALFICLFELARRVFAVLARRARFPRQFFLLLVFVAGFLLPLLAWEGVNYAASRYFAQNREIIRQFPSSAVLDVDAYRQPYVPFPRRLLETFRDNASHTGSLPADHLYFFRHLKDSEGWLVFLAVGAALAAALIRLTRKGAASEPILRLIVVFIGVAVIMNYTSGTQVARHYYSAFLIAAVVAGLGAASLLRRPRALFVLLPLAVFVAVQHFQHLKLYRESRQGPYLYGLWERDNKLTGQVGTMSMQQWDLWPTLAFFNNWKEFDTFVASRTHPHVMYSDYIGIAHGAWFYHTRDQLGMAETFRRCRLPPGAFAAASYLSYPPMLYENEFYYWGLLRRPSPYFDPRIKVIPIREVLRASGDLQADKSARRFLDERLARPKPVIIPAWKDRIILPFMERMERPSYLWPGIIAAGLLLAYTLVCLRRAEGS